MPRTSSARQDVSSPRIQAELSRALRWARAPEALAYVRRELPGKLRSTAKRLGISSQAVVKTLWKIARSQRMPRRAKVWALAGLLYWINPFDAVPDFLAGVGYVDDVLVLGTALAAATRAIKRAGGQARKGPFKHGRPKRERGSPA